LSQQDWPHEIGELTAGEDEDEETGALWRSFLAAAKELVLLQG